MSFKLREGFFRLVENNICIGPTPPGLHVWYEGCDDVIRRNIIINTEGTEIYEFIRCNPAYARQFDYNLFYNYKGAPVVRLKGGTTPPFKDVMSLTEWQAQSLDVYSVFADPLFINPAKGDYRVQQNSPALKLGASKTSRWIILVSSSRSFRPRLKKDIGFSTMRKVKSGR